MDPYARERDQEQQLDQDELTAEEQRLKDYQQTFLDSERGRRVLNDLLKQSMVFSTTFTGNSKTFFLEGSRNIGLYILAQLEISSYEDLATIREDGAGTSS